MLKTIANTLIHSAEKDLGVPLDEMRYVAEHSMSAFRRWSTTREIASYHHVLPVDVYYVAKIAAYRVEDCGSCLQICTHKGRQEGVPEGILQAALRGEKGLLPRDLREVFEFAEKQARREDDPAAREWIRQTWGDQGLIELAIGLASTRTFPTFKRVLGFAKSAAETAAA